VTDRPLGATDGWWLAVLLLVAIALIAIAYSGGPNP
jgi:cbb3-type cytochrome oxidase subunit 3